MKVRLTARGIEGLPVPENGQTDYFDTDGRYPGFSCRVTAAGRRVWYLVYRFNKKSRRLKLGAWPHIGLADARKKAKAALHNIDDGIDPSLERQERAEAVTFKELALDYLKRHSRPKKKSVDQDEYIIKHRLLPRWGKMLAKDVERRDVIRLHDEISQTAPTLANRAVQLISSMYSFGLDKDLVKTHPATRIKKNKENRRHRRLNEEEINRFWEASESISPRARAAFRLRLATGQRGREIAAMEWGEIDLEKKQWIIPKGKTKTGIEHLVPLNDIAIKILEDLPFSKDSRLFPGRRGRKYIDRLPSAVARIKQLSGIEDFQPRDLRRTFVSGCTELGIERLTVSKLVAHAEAGITGRHYDVYDYHLEKREAMGKWGRKLEQILSGEPETKVLEFMK